MKLLNLTQTHYSFEGKKSYENVMVLLYRHWIILVQQLMAFIFLSFLPIVVYVVVGSYINQAGLSSFFGFVAMVYYLAWWYGMFYMVTMYLLDTWVVTDHRIVDSEQHGFFNRTVSELTLSKIQDISIRSRGIIATFFDYGDLSVQTAGTRQRFLFKQIPHPQQVKDQIMQAHNDYLKTHRNGREVHEEL